MLVVFAVLATIAPIGRASRVLDPVGTHRALQAAAAILAVLTAFVLAIYSKVAANTESAWAAGGLAALGVLTIGAGALGPVVDPRAVSADPVAWLQPGSRGGVFVLLVVALWTSRNVSSWRRRPSRILLFTLASTGAATILFQLVPRAGRPFASVHDVAYGFAASRPTGVGAALPVLWLALSLAYVVTAARRREASIAWVALAFVGFGAAELGHRAMAETGQFVSAGAGMVQIAGLACALVGLTQHLLVVLGDRQGELLLRAEEAEAHADLARRHQDEQMHEARNALGGIVNALRMLDERSDSIGQDQQRELFAATFSELVRLQHLFAPEPSATIAAFDVSDTLAPIVASARASGLDVTLEVQGGLVAHGSWAGTAQAVQNLLENVRRHAPGSPARVEARCYGEHVMIRVSDDGPGVDPGEREAIFMSGARGARARSVPGSGLGLAITSELMRRQHGEVRLEDRKGGGASFVLLIPLDGSSAPSPVYPRVASLVALSG